MPASHDVLKGRLSRNREITLTVTGQKSGRAVANPVWFVFEDDKLYLLPVRGSDTQWYKNVLKNPSIRIKSGGAEAEFDVVAVTSPNQVSPVIGKFRAKCGDDGVKLYSKLDVAVIGQAR